MTNRPAIGFDAAGPHPGPHSLGAVAGPDWQDRAAAALAGRRSLHWGIATALGGFLVLAGQDATVKLLSATLTLPLILAVRSAAILALSLALGGRRLLRSVFLSPLRLLLLRRALVNLVAWSAYFTAARSLPLGQLASFQFLAPLIVVLAAGWMLGEHSGLRHRLLVVLGTSGALISGGSLGFEWQPALLLALLAAVLWAYSVMLTRRLARTEGPLVQLTATHLLFLAVLGPLALAGPVAPALAEVPLLLLVAVLGGAGQYALFTAARSVPAPVMAPLEYTSLLWNFILGYMLWRNVPGPTFLFGSALIALSCVGMVAGLRGGTATLAGRRGR